jgi:hypothetical protein
MPLFTIATPSPDQVFWIQGIGGTLPITVTGTAQKDSTILAGTRKIETVVTDIWVQLGGAPYAKATVVDGPTNKTWSATANASAGVGQALNVTATGRKTISDQQTPDVVSTATFSETQTLIISVREHALVVSATPYPVPTNKAVTVTVAATDLATGSAVAGQVLIGGKVVANTNSPFTYTFRTKRRPLGKYPLEWEVTYPEGVVRASGYAGASIDFGFPDA